MLNPLFSLCVYLVEMVISYIFFSSVFAHRYTPAKSLCIGGFLFTIGSAINILFQNNGVINMTSTCLINILFAHICFSTSLYKSSFYSALLGIINAAIEVSIVFSSSFLTDRIFYDYNSNFILMTFQAITIKTLYFLAILILIKVIRPQENHSTFPLAFLIYPICAAICQALFWHICSLPDTDYHVQFLLSLASICIFASTILLFVAYSHQLKATGQSLQMKSELARLQTEKSYYQILDQQNQQLMIYAHDAKKHLAAIQALNDDPQIGDYVKVLSQQLADYSRNCHSGNKLLDVIIHKYTVDCKMRGIQFEYDIKVCNLSQLDDIDLVAILGNLMDNAVAAAEDSAGKAISLNTVHRNSYSVIILTNSCDTPPKQAGDRLLSTKPDTQAHGFGLKSVKKTVQKYQGDLEWEYDAVAKQFTMTVMIADKKIECSANTSGNIC